ncbi:MAG: ester cyclase [Roseiarcus sp.]
MQRRQFLSSAALVAAAAAIPDAAEAEDAGAVVERFAAALSAHDMAAFADLFAEDYVNHQRSAAAPAPPAGKSPKQATLAFFQARLTGVPDLRVSIETSLASGDKAAASFVYEGAHGGVYYGVAPTGRPMRFTSCDIFRVRDGRIAEHWGMGDIAGVLAQLKG